MKKGIRVSAEENGNTEEKLTETKAEKQAAEKEKAKELAEKLESLSVEIVTKGGENGRLFGSITSKDISDALKDQHGITIDKKKIVLDTPIKETGEQIVKVKVYPEISADLKVKVSV
jgi:large subunit ribosomal protein L9